MSVLPSPQMEPFVREWQLSLQQFATKRHIARSVLHQTEIATWANDLLNEMAVGLSTYVLTDHLATEVVHAHTEHEEWTSWWQHTKAVLFPTLSRWLRRPPRTRTVYLPIVVDVQNMVTFPEHEAYPVPFGPPVRFQTASWERL